MQRFFDIFICIVALAFLSPVFLLICLILLFTGEREVFFIQNRVGKNGHEFGLIKFATMLKDSPSIGAGEITISGDPRVLPFGKFLRKSKLNELPQILNILIGDMTIVGPRPMVPNTYKKYPEESRRKLSRIRPGLTGIGSIIFRDEESFLMNQDDPMEFYITNIIPYKCNLEIWFERNYSIKLYFLIIFITAWIIIFPRSKAPDLAFKNLPPKPKIFG
jgi:lipopolysaccharide/colanic/teichoic acid biosynthesis glycosyltransferase